MPDFKFASRLSLIFFFLGTSLLVIYYFTMSPLVAQIGYSYTGIAILVSIIYLILVGFKVISKKLTQNTGLKCAGVILINLPVATGYFYFVMVLMTTARITFENATGHDISAVSVGGCVNKELGELKAGESTTLWVAVKNDCPLVLFYKLDRVPKLETPFGYLTPNNGMITTYKIGSNQKIMSPLKSGYAPVNGLQMYYEIYGHGKPVVLIHGGGSTIESNWSRVIPALSKSRQVIAVEMQAHGRTKDIDRDFTFEQDAIRATATASLTARTGVEMEAMTAVSIALLTIYDMAKAIDKAMIIEDIRLLAKRGGKSGDWQAPA